MSGPPAARGGRRGGGNGSGRGGGRSGSAGGGRGERRGRGCGSGGGGGRSEKAGAQGNTPNNNPGGNNKQQRGGAGGGAAAPAAPAAGATNNQQRPSSNQNSGGKGNQPKGRKKNDSNHPKKDAPVSEEELRRIEEDRLKKEAEAREEEARKAEAKKKEEEAVAAEAVAKFRAKEQEDLDQRLKDSIAILRSLVDNVHQHQACRQSMAEDELNRARKDFEANKKTLKTDLKKCTAFVKKIKSGAAWSMKPEDIVKDVASLNLSRYVEEVVTAVLEAKPKVTDIPVIVALTTSMHERYPEYLPNLISSLWNLIASKADADTLKSRRVYLRVLTEFLLCGVLTETKNLLKIVVEAAGGKDGTYVVQDAHLVVAFTKQAGPEIFGVTPTSVAQAAAQIRMEYARTQTRSENSTEVFASADLVSSGIELVEQMEDVLKSRAVDAQVSDVAMAHCLGAFKAMSESLVQSHLSLRKMEKRCEQDRLVLGSLTEAREKGLAEARKRKDSLFKCVENLSDVLAQPVPHLQEEEEELNQDGPGIEVLAAGGEGENTNFGPFDDEETRAFYCDIPDYLTTIPPALLGLTLETIESKKAENMAKYGESVDAEIEEVESAQDLPADAERLLEAEVDPNAGEGVQSDEVEGEEEEDKETPRYKLTVLLEQELPECHGREQIDEISERFCSNHGSSKNARKRLAKTLFQIPHARLDLLPFYSRMAATVDRVWSDTALQLLTNLEQQFHGQAKFKKNQNLESRMRTARYIGELTKFRVAPPIIFLRCMRRCLDDFTGSNVDIACCLLEAGGRFLYKLKHTNPKITGIMEAMARLGKAKYLDERLQSSIKAAFFSVKPPQSGSRRLAKEYPPLESYLRYLLLVRLEPTDSTVTEVVKQLMRFPWSKPTADCGNTVNRIMLKACRKGRYKTIEAVAAVVAGLRRRGAVEVSIRLVDSVIEELRWALEHPNFRDQQRTITYARLLGELFCRSQVSGKLVIDQLYDFINVGHEIPPALREASKKMVEMEKTDGQAQNKLPEYNSSGAVAQTIAEDEEMDDMGIEKRKEHENLQPVAVSDHSKFDPRVPSDVDPPAAAYRIKLVCTLLEVTSRHLVSKANLVALQGFLTALQRYLFTKPILPTEVEFSLLDTFDAVDSQWRKTTKSAGSLDGTDGGFKRYQSWLEAHNATVAAEEAEAVDNEKKRSDLEAIADSSKSLEDIMTRMIEQNFDDESISHMDEEEEGSLVFSGKGSVHDRSHGDETESENDDADRSDQEDEDLESENEGESDDTESEEIFDEEAYARQLEEEAFERELRRLTMDALEKGKSASRKIVASDMISGSQVVKKKMPDQQPKVEGEQPKMPSFWPSSKAGVTVQLLRKGNKGKVEAKELVVPMETNLAIAATRKDAAAARERDEIKLRVLQYEADSAEAELTGGNVYLEQEKLQVIRNKPLSIEDIDRNFGTTRGDLRKSDASKTASAPAGRVARPLRGGPARGRGARGSGRAASGRGLF
ncbi:hypothetical protein ACA910_012493 [Epithemia clementina (nom. ined.)]